MADDLRPTRLRHVYKAMLYDSRMRADADGLDFAILVSCRL